MAQTLSPPVSRRLSHLLDGGSDGWGVYRRARALAARGVAVTDLTIGEHDIGTDPAILDAMDRAARGGHTGYAAVPGTEALRRAVADRVSARTGVPTAPANVLITPGGQAGLFAAHMAACDPGDVALYCDPYYATYPGTLRAAGAVPRAVLCDPARGFQPARAALDAAAQGARSLLINTPNNPTGAVYGPETLADIAAVCRAHDLWLISDEVYDTQVWDGRHLSPRALPDMAARTLVVGSMSKSHAMTGSRIGWIVGPELVVAQLIDLATNTTYGVPGYIQDAAAWALADTGDLEARIAAPFRRRRAIAQRLVDGQSVVRLVPPQGAMYAMLDVRATGMSGEGFAEALLDRHAIAVMPGESFGRAAAGHVRVALTVDDTRLEDALARLLSFAGEPPLEATA
ncbi:pyridoxal phosphate-dependent aminotransferase [Rhodobacteraceae bacterium CCMM004]|nr:pyridoxal phosphate-dependent aminotransferase [Rhodobacteraceae bacterium CCMM004]